MTRSKRLSWALWGLCSLVAGATLGDRLLGDARSRELFLPGKTTSGHYQIELECGACHTAKFSSADDLQGACVSCHGGELLAAKDSHPTTKFTDPRNAARVEILDGRYCVTCHAEHRPERTGSMGLSLPADYCYHCHQDIGEERTSHAGLPFDGCASTGCHNFHDNRALYEDYLVQHGAEPWLLAAPIIQPSTAAQAGGAGATPAPRALTLADADGPDRASEHARAWAASEHARAGVNCFGCHVSSGAAFEPAVPASVCGDCHRAATDGWLSGKHGMRVKAGLPPMRVADARQPMKAAAHDGTSSCASCHGQHETETERAALEACESCHDDRHTRAYRQSKHFDLVVREREQRVAAGSGVTCATCHMPRSANESGATTSQHNQNDNLRPSEKMVRSVCQNCHGLAFALDALADTDLVLENFGRAPEAHVPSVDFALRRAE